MLTRLRLTGYRNLADVRLAFPPEGVALVGENAQGKTNLLEAIYYLEIFRSFRGTRDSRIIRFEEDHFRVEGHLAREGSVRVVAAAYQRRGQVKKVVVDGIEPPRLGDAIGEVAAVLFTPEDVRIVSDGPDERRRFLDILLSLNLPGYLEDLQRYRQALSQRNAVLRDSGPDAAVRAWDAPLARSGGRVAAGRALWIDRYGDAFAEVFSEISGGESARMRYQPGTGAEAVADRVVSDPETEAKPKSDPESDLEPDPESDLDRDPESDLDRDLESERASDLKSGPERGPDTELNSTAETWEAAILNRLTEGLESDRRRSTTQAGPHRDELRMHLAHDEPRDLRHFGSGGQRRTAALALRIIEARTVAERRGHAPLLLLDDVFAELDAARSRAVVGLLERTAAGQVILTAPKESDLHFRSDRLARWTVADGVIDTGGAAES